MEKKTNSESTKLDNPGSNSPTDESTIYDNEPAPAQTTATPPVNDKTDHTWQKVTIGGVAGIVIGAAVSYAGTAKADADAADDDAADGNGNPLIDDSIDIAANVNDDMTFSQAFDAARQEVGPGGVFIWQGRIYNTYTAEEWDNMTTAQRDDFADNFVWNHGRTTHHEPQPHDNATAQATQATQTAAADPQPQPADTPAQETVIPNNNDEIAVQSVETETDVQVLGVVHDEESGMNFGGVVVNGQEVMLVDVNDDNVFDLAAADLNNDGRLDDNEIAELRQPITTDDLGGFTDGSDGPDYINDDMGANGFT